MARHFAQTMMAAAAVLVLTGAATAAQASEHDLDRPVSETELSELAAAYERGALGSGRCDWVHPVSEGPTTIPCEVVPLPVLARMARNVANKHAQMELGLRFEEGRGVAQDYRMARRYYRMAARDSRRGVPVLLARRDVSALGFGEAIIQEAGYSRPRVPGWAYAVGLPEAQERLRNLPPSG